MIDRIIANNAKNVDKLHMIYEETASVIGGGLFVVFMFSERKKSSLIEKILCR